VALRILEYNHAISPQTVLGRFRSPDVPMQKVAEEWQVEDAAVAKDIALPAALPGASPYNP
jgi:hypothetical protein